jgi:predicted TIM-barrel fold metal-dependent hydrolase
MSSYKELRSAIDEIPIFDTHEEIYYLKTKRFEEWLARGVDLLDVLKGVWLFTAFDFPERKSDFSTLSKCLKRIQGQGHLRAAVRGIYSTYGIDISSFDEKVLSEASNMISRSYKNKDWIKKVLTGSGIKFVILDVTPTYDLFEGFLDKEHFAGALKIDMFLRGYNRTNCTKTGESVYTFADILGVKIESFDDYLSFIDLVFSKARERGIIAVKCKIAYERELRFEEVKEQEARAVFNRPAIELSQGEIKKFSDFMMHYIIQKATEVGFPIQIHTGMSYQTNYEGSNPLKLTNLFIKYPDTKFILFHGGYPWTSEAASLAFSHRNVYVDICWLPMVSTTASERLISELIDTTGASKITWGGDTGIAEGACGALAITRDIVAKVLTKYIEDGYLNYSNAITVAKKIFFENAQEIYQLTF